jgi:alpha-1,3-mannosyltransferase
LALTKFFYDAPLICSSHGLFFHTSFAKNLKNLYFKTITRLSLKNVTAVACDSQQDYTLLTSIVSPEKLAHIPNGVNYKLFSSFLIENKDPNLLISIGNLTINKRQDKLLEAFAHLTQLNPEATLVIIGADKGRLLFLKELSLKLGIHHNVKFAGKISNQDLFEHLSKACVFLSASAYEGFGIALLESMASGCLPIVQTNPAHHELVQNDLFLTNFDDHIQAAQKIQSIMSLSFEAKAELIKALRANSAHYSWENIARQYMQIYTDAVENSR